MLSAANRASWRASGAHFKACHGEGRGFESRNHTPHPLHTKPPNGYGCQPASVGKPPGVVLLGWNWLAIWLMTVSRTGGLTLSRIHWSADAELASSQWP